MPAIYQLMENVCSTLFHPDNISNPGNNGGYSLRKPIRMPSSPPSFLDNANYRVLREAQRPTYAAAGQAYPASKAVTASPPTDVTLTLLARFNFQDYERPWLQLTIGDLSRSYIPHNNLRCSHEAWVSLT